MTERHAVTILSVLSALCLLAATFLGSTAMGPGRVLAALSGAGPSTDELIVWSIRLPRAVAAFLVGAALGASGAALQGLLRNPLAEPGVLGVTGVATLSATTALYFGLASVSALVVPLAAIGGAAGAVALLAVLAIRVQSVVTLILIGVGISSFSGALMALLLNFAPNPFSLSDMINWTLGSVAHRSIDDIALTAPFMLVGIGILMMSANGLSALALGEEAAMTMGLNLRRQRLLTIGGAGLATGGAVAMAGAVGFVGIVAPHLVRPWVGHDPGRSIFPAALCGGVMVLGADIFVRILPTQTEMKLGVVAALIGAPIFVLIALRRGGSEHATGGN